MREPGNAEAGCIGAMILFSGIGVSVTTVLVAALILGLFGVSWPMTTWIIIAAVISVMMSAAVLVLGVLINSKGT